MLGGSLPPGALSPGSAMGSESLAAEIKGSGYGAIAGAFHTRTRARRGSAPVMASIHQTLKGARSLYLEAFAVAQVGGVVAGAGRETSRVRLKYLGQGFLALVFVIGTLAGMAGGFLALLAFRLAGGAD